MNSPLVSVYIPTHNRLALLKRSINSIFEQTYKHIELVVADDGSSDGTRDYLSKLQDAGQLRAILLPVSMGACVARNFAICQSNGEFLTGLDDDDYFLPGRIESFVSKWKQMEGNGFSVPVAGLFDDLIFLKTREKELRHRYPSVVSYQNLLEKNHIGNQVFAPRKTFLESGLFDPRMPIWQDWDLWRRISRDNGHFINLGIGTYVVDQAHGYARTTSEPEFAIRYAMAMLEDKCGVSSLRVKSSLLIACLSNPQANLTLNDTFLLLRAGRLTTLAKLLVKQLLRIR